MLKLALAALHLLALGLGLGAVINRGTALREAPNAKSLRRAFRADSLWGIAAVLWLATGAWRLFAGIEKPAAYYYNNELFLGKMALFIVIGLLEIWPMWVLIRWRIALRRGAAAEQVGVPSSARRIALISHVEALLLVLMLFAAVAMARGYGLWS